MWWFAGLLADENGLDAAVAALVGGEINRNKKC